MEGNFPISEPSDQSRWTVYFAETRRPAVSLAFVAPMLLVYEVGILAFGPQAMRNGADLWLRLFLDWIGVRPIFFVTDPDCVYFVSLALLDPRTVAIFTESGGRYAGGVIVLWNLVARAGTISGEAGRIVWCLMDHFTRDNPVREQRCGGGSGDAPYRIFRRRHL